MKRLIPWTAAVVTAASASVALAASVGLSTPTLGTGQIAVVACETNGFTLGYTTSRGNVTALTVGAIADPACEGGTISVTVTDAAGASIATAGPQLLATDAGTVDNTIVLPTSPQPAAALVAGYHVSITGP